MTRAPSLVTSLTAVVLSASAIGAEHDFSGTWQIDLRTPAERLQHLECGTAEFILVQAGDKVSGEHSFSTVGCGRVNEGGEGTVKGVVVDSAAVLVVTSGRNGGMVLGKATRSGNKLQWVTLEELKPGEPEGDSPLILEKGELTLVAKRKRSFR